MKKILSAIIMSSSLLILFGCDLSKSTTVSDVTTITTTTERTRATTTTVPDPIFLSGTTPDEAITKTGYTLFWNDEFSGTSLDTDKWTYEIGRGSGGWGNGEVQYYSDRYENIRVEDGALKIIARRGLYEGAWYSSARIKTEDKFEFTYGYVEARIALPKDNGLWPAFWMLGANHSEASWPRCGEIDILETIDANDSMFSTIHWYQYGVNSLHHAETGTTQPVTGIDQFHTYALEWDSSSVTFSVDGVRFRSISTGTMGESAFLKDFFLILNVAVGGKLPKKPIALAEPKAMVVDYVRVFKKN